MTVLDYVLTLSDGTRMRVQALDAAEAATMADDVVSTVQVHPGTTAPVVPTDVSAYFREANVARAQVAERAVGMPAYVDVAEFEAYNVQRTYRVASGMRDVWQDRETDRLDAQDRASQVWAQVTLPRLTY